MQRLNHIEDHLAVVRQLLTSADACTLEAKQKIDQLIDQLTTALDRVAF